MICVYTFKAFRLPADISLSADFVCFQNAEAHSGWVQRSLPLDILPFSEIRQKKILKILSWKYLPEYDYAIYVSSEQYLQKVQLLIESLEKNPYSDIYLLSEEAIDKQFYLELNPRNLNLKSQLQKYLASSKYDPKFFYNTDCIAFNNRSADFKQFSINWMSETMKESLNDEVSFSWLLSFSPLNVCKCRYEIKDADCFFKIVIPNYNNGQALEKCVESILSQSFRSFKIVIVDDCSTDDSRRIAEQYAVDYPEQIFFLSTKSRAYSGAARNLGIDFKGFTSKYTWFVDGDDLLYKDSVLKDLFEKASITKADLISLDCAYVKNRKPTIKKFSVPDFSNPLAALDQFGIAPWHRIVKSEKVVRFFEPCLRRQDLATVFRQLNACSTFAHLDKVCYIYNSRDYETLAEPVWNLQTAFVEMKRQASDMSIKEDLRKCIDTYLSKYPKIFGTMDVEQLRNQKVVAMASYPLRREGMMKAFKQLFPQCDHFCLYLNEYQEIPSEFAELSADDKKKLTIEVRGENLKDYGKFFWLKKFPGYYMTVDDDLDYPHDYCEKLSGRMKDFSNEAVLGMHGNDFTILDNSFVVKKTCHAFSSEEKYDVPVDCLGTGAACFYPSNLKFSFADLLQDYRKDLDLDMSVSIRVKEENKMLYRVSSKKAVVSMNGNNYISPLANIHFAWEKRYLQYDFWLNRGRMSDKCAVCIVRKDKIDVETMQILSDVRKDYAKSGIDFYCVPVEEKKLLMQKDSSSDFYFAKFEIAEEFSKVYSSVRLHPLLTDRDVAFEFAQGSDDFRRIREIRQKNLKRMSDKILLANLKKRK